MKTIVVWFDWHMGYVGTWEKMTERASRGHHKDLCAGKRPWATKVTGSP